MVISIERFIAVCRPFRARWHSNRRSVCALLLVIATSALYNFVRFFEFRLSHSEDPNAPIDTVPVLRDGEENLMYMAVYYTGLFFIVHFLIPFSVLTVTNSLMIGSIYRAGAQRRLLSSQQKKEHRTAIMMAMTVVAFLACNTLHLILNAVELWNPKFFDQESTLVLAFSLNDACNLLIVFNTSCTAFIYYFFCQKYRRVASELYARICKCASEPSPKHIHSCAAFVDAEAKLSMRRRKPAQAVVMRAYEPRLLRYDSVLRVSGYQSIVSDGSKKEENLDNVIRRSLKEALSTPDDSRTTELTETSRMAWSPYSYKRKCAYGRYIDGDKTSAPPVMV